MYSITLVGVALYACTTLTTNGDSHEIHSVSLFPVIYHLLLIVGVYRAKQGDSVNGLDV